MEFTRGYVCIFVAPPPLPVERKSAHGLPEPLCRPHEPKRLAPLQRGVTGNLGWVCLPHNFHPIYTPDSDLFLFLVTLQLVTL